MATIRFITVRNCPEGNEGNIRELDISDIEDISNASCPEFEDYNCTMIYLKSGEVVYSHMSPEEFKLRIALCENRGKP